VPVLVSSCLLGIACRYDGAHSRVEEIVKNAHELHIVPVCPEQLGGLPTPRLPSNMVNGDGGGVLTGVARVVNTSGEDVTTAFLKGARETLSLAQLTGATKALLRKGSPSCGLTTSYCETDSGYGVGVTAALLIKAGIEIIEIDPDHVSEDFTRDL
jgi:uncharacterized protein YbbK (DUF523 family)